MTEAVSVSGAEEKNCRVTIVHITLLCSSSYFVGFYFTSLDNSSFGPGRSRGPGTVWRGRNQPGACRSPPRHRQGLVGQVDVPHVIVTLAELLQNSLVPFALELPRPAPMGTVGGTGAWLSPSSCHHRVPGRCTCRGCHQTRGWCLFCVKLLQFKVFLLHQCLSAYFTKAHLVLAK